MHDTIKQNIVPNSQVAREIQYLENLTKLIDL